MKPSVTPCLDDVHFDMGTRVLSMPEVMLDDSTEYRYQNVMAFEALHAGTGNDVTAFVLFVRDMIDSVADVVLLGRKRILKHDLAGGDAAVVRLFEQLTKDVAKIGKSRLCRIRRKVETYCDEDSWRVFIFKSWSKLKNTLFHEPVGVHCPRCLPLLPRHRCHTGRVCHHVLRTSQKIIGIIRLT